MEFVPKEWKDRLVEFAGRRKLTNVETGEEIIVDVARNEGAVSQEGDAFSAENMNDLEQRVADEFNQINSDLPKIQCGSSSIIKNTQTSDITFNKPFSSIPTVIVSPKDLISDQWVSDVRSGTFIANNVTVNGFQCFINRNANKYDLPFYWIAME